MPDIKPRRIVTVINEFSDTAVFHMKKGMSFSLVETTYENI